MQDEFSINQKLLQKKITNQLHPITRWDLMADLVYTPPEAPPPKKVWNFFVCLNKTTNVFNFFAVLGERKKKRELNYPTD